LKWFIVVRFVVRSAGLGVAAMLVQGMVQQGLAEADARKRFYICDKDGLLGRSRGAAAFAKLDPLAFAFARQDEGLPSGGGETFSPPPPFLSSSIISVQSGFDPSKTTWSQNRLHPNRNRPALIAFPATPLFFRLARARNQNVKRIWLFVLKTILANSCI
jgi:hypothetical protein